MSSHEIVNYRVSVDCVVFGFDGERLNVLLYRMLCDNEDFHTMKLPGALIRKEEGLDEAAVRVLHDLTGLDGISLTPFRAFGSPDRTSNPKDMQWVQHWEKQKIERAITAAYVALIRIDSSTVTQDGFQTLWVPIDELPELAFDHNLIVSEAIANMKGIFHTSPDRVFAMLPGKFTADQLRKLYIAITGKRVDARNFYKILAVKPYIVALEEREKGVSHRAARYYRFDRRLYEKFLADKNLS